MIQNAGTQLVTTSGVVGAAGQAVRIFAINILSGGGGAAIIKFRNGSTVGATIWLSETGTTNTGLTVSYGTQGVLFPSGCFVSTDANTTSVTVTYNNNS